MNTRSLAGIQFVEGSWRVVRDADMRSGALCARVKSDEGAARGACRRELFQVRSNVDPIIRNLARLAGNVDVMLTALFIGKQYCSVLDANRKHLALGFQCKANIAAILIQYSVLSGYNLLKVQVISYQMP